MHCCHSFKAQHPRQTAQEAGAVSIAADHQYLLTWHSSKA
jgi:hypothetical protein